MTTYFTPLVRVEVADDFAGPWEIGRVSLRAASDDDLRRYFGIADRTFDSETGQVVGYTTLEDSGLRMAALGLVQAIRVHSSTCALVSELPIDQHQSAVCDVLRCWRLLRVSQVAAPVTLNSDGPSSAYGRPLECRLGGSLTLDEGLVEQSRDLFKNLAQVPDSDLILLDMVNEFGCQPLTIVLLTTLLERSLMRSDSNEIAFKVALYGARLLSGAGHVAHDVFADLRRAYSLRSRYLHGGEHEIPELEGLLVRLYGYATKIRVLSATQPERVSPESKVRLAIGD